LITFPAWVTLSTLDLAPLARGALAVLVFVTAGSGLTLYVRWCIKRNCAMRQMLSAGRVEPMTARR
jgi:hypothetical protein